MIKWDKCVLYVWHKVSPQKYYLIPPLQPIAFLSCSFQELHDIPEMAWTVQSTVGPFIASLLRTAVVFSCSSMWPYLVLFFGAFTLLAEQYWVGSQDIWFFSGSFTHFPNKCLFNSHCVPCTGGTTQGGHRCCTLSCVIMCQGGTETINKDKTNKSSWIRDWRSSDASGVGLIEQRDGFSSAVSKQRSEKPQEFGKVPEWSSEGVFEGWVVGGWLVFAVLLHRAVPFKYFFTWPLCEILIAEIVENVLFKRSRGSSILGGRWAFFYLKDWGLLEYFHMNCC